MSNWEVQLARGKTIQEFETEINRIAKIRDKEIDAALDRHEDVFDDSIYHFKPHSPVNFVGEEFQQVWMRQKP